MLVVFSLLGLLNCLGGGGGGHLSRRLLDRLPFLTTCRLLSTRLPSALHPMRRCPLTGLQQFLTGRTAISRFVSRLEKLLQ